MKKIILVAAAILGFAIAATAQPRAVGIKIGNGLEGSYQHSFGSNFVEADLGLYAFNSLSVAGTYNFMLGQPEWTTTGEWGIYAGPGAAIGCGSGFFHAAVAGQVGIEYTFDFPLQLSFDLRPQIGAVMASSVSAFYYDIIPSLGIRYKF